jgi:biotin carboxyl carrier protein
MKMENEIQASIDGVVDEIFVTAGDTVESGADLVHMSARE